MGDSIPELHWREYLRWKETRRPKKVWRNRSNWNLYRRGIMEAAALAEYIPTQMPAAKNILGMHGLKVEEE
jgi:hypothetical protein